MQFNSMQYVIFLPIVFMLYWALPHKFRWGLLLAASYYFYMSWSAKYVVLILFTTVVSYVAAIQLEKESGEKKRGVILTLTLVVCLGVLGVFKYYNFFLDTLTNTIGFFGIRIHPVALKILLPVGISFYTFQTLSYVIDVYRGEIKAEKHFGIYAAFVSFFPQLVAGPIERTKNLLPQIKTERHFNADQAIYGAKLLLWGYYKKLIIADYLAPFVDMIYNDPTKYSGSALLAATLFFTLQIYCDFSAYSDIARGTAKLMGIELMINFKSPYLSESLHDFWTRWHISLSTWFRDYVYIPMGGNRRGRLRHYFNLLVTFLASGLWHGASWTFVIWGGVHGVAQVVENVLKLNKKKDCGIVKRVVRMSFVFAFTAFAWTFFRAGSLSDALYILAHMFDGISAPAAYLRDGLIGVMDYKWMRSLFTFVTVSLLLVYDCFDRDDDAVLKLESFGKIFNWAFYLGIGFLTVLFAEKGAGTVFVYFQF